MRNVFSLLFFYQSLIKTYLINVFFPKKHSPVKLIDFIGNKIFYCHSNHCINNCHWCHIISARWRKIRHSSNIFISISRAVLNLKCMKTSRKSIKKTLRVHCFISWPSQPSFTLSFSTFQRTLQNTTYSWQWVINGLPTSDRIKD